ncbi:Conserved_hypothetical protein [Hexamita inflata]|uniref:Uncharacterized protein n=1 Tax=Hexamita inflata TaxID=28002 RepID=A0AA86P8U9_9EUKA|nr:Conserved hypothetical protein [Hexamita inflata]
MNLQNDIFLSQKSSNIHLFIQTEVTKQASIDVTVNNVEVSLFALFGFNVNSQTISDSLVNVTLQFEVITGALICITCDITVLSSTLVFIASGQQISGLILETLLNVNLFQSFVQYRINCLHSSGLINVINQESVNFQIKNCKLSGYNYLQSDFNGYIASSILINFMVTYNQFIICIDSTNIFGVNSNVTIIVIGSETLNCDICAQYNIAYGLCVDYLDHSRIDDGVLKCKYPFEYINNSCICASGYLLNITECINIVTTFADIQMQIYNIYQADTVQQDITDIIQNISQFELSLVNEINSAVSVIGNNLTLLEGYIISNYSQADANLLSNSSALDQRILNNITSLSQNLTNDVSHLTSLLEDLSSNLMQNSTKLENYILQNYSNAESNLLLKTSVLDQRIIQNITSLSSKLASDVSQQNQQINDLHSNIVANVSYLESYILQKYSVVETNIISNTSAIDQRIFDNITLLSTTITNGISQLNSQISSMNNNLVTNSTNLEYYIFTNYSKADLSLQANTSVLDQRIFHNATLLANNLTINSSNLEQYIISNFSKTDTNLLANSTVLDRRIFDNITALNSSIQVKMNILDSTVYSLNINIQSVNQEEIQQQIYINKLQHQINCIISGTLVGNDTCKYQSQINYSNDTQMCNQPMFATIFDLDVVTIQVLQSDISVGFVFSSIIINDAFINIQDSAYLLVVQPLFQFQNCFTNLKLQLGVQSVNNGVIISNGNTITINQLNIVSRTGTQITVTDELNVLQIASNDVQISNLLLNLSFMMATGNIALINTITGTANITTYQIIGNYQSSGTVAMIALLVNSATVHIQQVNFMPNVYNIGNISSYFISNVVQSSIQITNIAVFQNNSQVLSEISTRYVFDEGTGEEYYYYFQFGGIVTLLSNTTLNIIDIIYQAKQTVHSNSIHYFGLIIGIGLSLNVINIQNQCIQQLYSIQVGMIIGLIGQINGDVYIKQSIVNIIIIGQQNAFGIIGILEGNILKIEDIQITFINLVSSSQSSQGSALIGRLSSLQCILQHVHIYNTNLSTYSWTGAVTGYLIYNKQFKIYDSIIENTLISCTKFACGGITGFSIDSNIEICNISFVNSNISAPYASGFISRIETSNVSITNSKILNVSIISEYYVGGFVGECGRNIYGQPKSSTKTVNILNSQIMNSNVSAQNAGGFLGFTIWTNVIISGSKVISVRITGTVSQGIVLAEQSTNTTLSITFSQSFGNNYINDVVQNDCANLVDTWSVTQC